MQVRILLLIILHLPTVLVIDCYCSGCRGEKLCAGDYCYLRKGGIEEIYDWRSGCITPREDAWVNEHLPLCERNQQGGILCLCNNGDRCNVVDTFSKVLANESFVEQKLIECTNIDPCPRPGPFEDPTVCTSPHCMIEELRKYNDFFDLENDPYTEVYRQCPNVYDAQFYTFRIKLDGLTPQMNSCLHMRHSAQSSSVTCFCNTTRCNENITMYNLPERGKGICYLKLENSETTTCYGDYCFWTGNNRGCLDASGADPNFKLRLGESLFDDEFVLICEGNYCNSDFKYPNGTIVGPSATRPFSTNADTSFQCQFLAILLLAMSIISL